MDSNGTTHILNWVLKHRETHLPFYVGINGPQGSGKTTLTSELVDLLNKKEIPSVCISIDDFYLTRDEQQNLADANKNNPFWQQRGYPGTHDIELGIKTLTNLEKIPRYNKSAFQGLGDRFAKSEWEKLNFKPHVVFLEGWMLGFRANNRIINVLSAFEDCDSKQSLQESISSIDSSLENYEPWLKFLNAFVYLQANDFHYVLDWRVEAEQRMKSEGKSGMSDEQVKAYAKLFLPAYERYENTISKETLGDIPFLHLKLNKNRQPDL